ncbi:MAG: hypothetical protein ACREJM_13230, partial [Candidatus Saccharimonadales bacterium]
MSLSSILDRLASRRVLPRRKKRLRPARFFVEALEQRALLTAYVVNSTNPGFGGDGANTLVEAIGLADADTGDSSPFVINFNIPTSDAGYSSETGAWTIQVLTLPEITHPVIIDGTTQATNQGQAYTKPLIDIDGSQAQSQQFSGLEFLVGGNTVEGLIINNFRNFGIVLDGSDDFVHGNGPGLNNIIQSNFIGTDATGRVAAPNAAGGIDLVQSSYNLIGGPNNAGPLSTGNLISGNGQTGIFLEDQSDHNNYIEGNYVGTDVDGLKALPAPGGTGTDGIFLGPPGGSPQQGFASNNFIGNFDPASQKFEPNGRNVIGGNTKNGVYVLGGSGNLIAGNYIGIGSDGSTPVGNGGDGVRLEDGSSNIVGGTQANAGNVISANQQNGIDIVADATSENFISMPVAKQAVVSNIVQGNDIGTDNDAFATHQGQTPLGNGQEGMVLA